MNAGSAPPDALRLDVAAVLDALRGPVLVVDTDGRITGCSKEFSRCFGDPPNDGSWVGQPERAAVELVSRQASDPVGFRRRAQQINAAAVAALDEFDASDGRVFELDFLPMSDRTDGNGDSAHRGHVWHYRDVTDERAATRARERLLRAEVTAQRLGVHAQRTRAAEAERTGQDLEQRNRALVATDLLRKELLATASHELRTPLTTILGYSELMADEPLDAQVGSYVDAIARNARRVLELVDDLLLLARMGSGTEVLQRRPVDLSALITAAVQDASALAAPRGITVEAKLPPALALSGDAAALTRAIGNVLANAVKYAHDDGRVDVAAHAGHTEITVAIRDQGIGIPPGELDVVFDQFFRGSTARASGRPGTGLGLAIVRGIVEQHEGEISIDSEVGVGTTVTITLPR